MAHNELIWRILPLSSFKKDVFRLNPKARWEIGKLLDAMARKKDPTKDYENEICCEEDPNWRLFGFYDDGVGNKRLEMLIYLNYEKKIMYPAGVFKNRPSSN